MRILADISAVVDPQKTGVGYLAQALVEALARDPEVDLEGFYFNFLGRNALGAEQGLPVYKVTWLPTKVLTFLQKSWSCFPPVRLFVPSAKTFDWIFYPNYIAYPPPHSARPTRNVLFIHDTLFLDYPEEGNGWLNKALGKALKRRPLIICNSQATRAAVLRHFPAISPDDILVIWVPLLPVIESTPDDSILTQHGLVRDSYLLFTSSLTTRKIGVLLDAYVQLPADLRQRYPLVLVGAHHGLASAEVIDRLMQLKAQYPDTRIIATGYIDDAQRNALYAGAHLFVHPSLAEGFGMPLLEAMHFGRTILASDIEVFHEVAGDDVRYFDPHDASALCSALTEELETGRAADPDRYAEVLRKATWDEVAASVVDFLKQHAEVG